MPSIAIVLDQHPTSDRVCGPDVAVATAGRAAAAEIAQGPNHLGYPRAYCGIGVGMFGLILGMLIWIGVHLMPSVARPVRANLIERLGEQKYQGLFAMGILISLGLIIFGWRSTPPVSVYAASSWGRTAALLLIYPALVLFVASGLPTNIKRVLRHPQLSGVLVWSVGHLLANGESRSLVLFGGMAAWALVAMVTINRRDGDWVRPEPIPASGDLKPILIAAVAYGVLLFAHPYLSGVSAMPG